MNTIWTGRSQEVTACLLCAFPGHFLKTTVGKCRNGSSDDRQCNHSNTRTRCSSQPSSFYAAVGVVQNQSPFYHSNGFKSIECICHNLA